MPCACRCVPRWKGKKTRLWLIYTFILIFVSFFWTARLYTKRNIKLKKKNSYMYVHKLKSKCSITTTTKRHSPSGPHWTEEQNKSLGLSAALIPGAAQSENSNAHGETLSVIKTPFLTHVQGRSVTAWYKPNKFQMLKKKYIYIMNTNEICI